MEIQNLLRGTYGNSWFNVMSKSRLFSTTLWKSIDKGPLWTSRAKIEDSYKNLKNWIPTWKSRLLERELRIKHGIARCSTTVSDFRIPAPIFEKCTPFSNEYEQGSCRSLNSFKTVWIWNPFSRALETPGKKGNFLENSWTLLEFFFYHVSWNLKYY